jgi:hypothetical protein
MFSAEISVQLSYMRTQLLAVILGIVSIFPASARAESRKTTLWRVSAALLGAVTIADVQSSLGRPESNAFLRSPDGRFATRGVALKTVAVGAALGAQWLMMRRHPQAAPYAAAANFAAASLTGAVVIHNHMLK